MSRHRKAYSLVGVNLREKTLKKTEKRHNKFWVTHCKIQFLTSRKTNHSKRDYVTCGGKLMCENPTFQFVYAFQLNFATLCLNNTNFTHNSYKLNKNI